jgi:hypothetical protein
LGGKCNNDDRVAIYSTEDFIILNFVETIKAEKVGVVMKEEKLTIDN